MDQHTMIVVIAAVIVIALIALAGWFYSLQRRSKQLRQRFGPEYDRVVRAITFQLKTFGWHCSGIGRSFIGCWQSDMSLLT